MEITIIDRRWKVERVPSNSPELYVDGEMCKGTCWPGHHKICLSSDLQAINAKEVIIHEVTHAVISSSQVHTPETFDEEDLCEFTAKWSRAIVQYSEYLYTSIYGGEHNESNTGT